MFNLAEVFRKQPASERLAGYHLRPDLLEAADAMVSDARSDRYVAALQPVLRASETVLRIVDGRHRGRWGILALTSERLVFNARKGADPVSLDVPLTTLTSIEGSTHHASGTLRLVSATGTEAVDKILGNQGETMAAEARLLSTGERDA